MTSMEKTALGDPNEPSPGSTAHQIALNMSAGAIGMAGKDFMEMARQKARERKEELERKKAKFAQEQDQVQTSTGGPANVSKTESKRSKRHNIAPEILDLSSDVNELDNENKQTKSTELVQHKKKQARRRVSRQIKSSSESSETSESPGCESDVSAIDDSDDVEEVEPFIEDKIEQGGRRTSARLKAKEAVLEAMPNVVTFGAQLDSTDSIAPVFLDASSRRARIIRPLVASPKRKDESSSGRSQISVPSARRNIARLEDLSGQIEGFTAGAKLTKPGVSSNDIGTTNRSAFDFLLQASVDRVEQVHSYFDNDSISSSQLAVMHPSLKHRISNVYPNSPFGTYLRSDTSPYYYVAMESDKEQSTASNLNYNALARTSSKVCPDNILASKYTRGLENMKWTKATVETPIPLEEFSLPWYKGGVPTITTPATREWPLTDEAYSDPRRISPYHEKLVSHEKKDAIIHLDDIPNYHAEAKNGICSLSPSIVTALISDEFASMLSSCIASTLNAYSSEVKAPSSSTVSELMIQFLLSLAGELMGCSQDCRELAYRCMKSLADQGYVFSPDAPTLAESCVELRTARAMCESLANYGVYSSESVDLVSLLLQSFIQTLPTYAIAVRQIRAFLRNFSPVSFPCGSEGRNRTHTSTSKMRRGRKLSTAKKSRDQKKKSMNTHFDDSSSGNDSSSGFEDNYSDSGYESDIDLDDEESDQYWKGTCTINSYEGETNIAPNGTSKMAKQSLIRDSLFLAPDIIPSATAALCVHGDEKAPLSQIISAACQRTHKTLEINATSGRSMKHILDICSEATQSHIVASGRGSMFEGSRSTGEGGVNVFDTFDVTREGDLEIQRELKKKEEQKEKEKRATRGVLGMLAGFKRKKEDVNEDNGDGSSKELPSSQRRGNSKKVQLQNVVSKKGIAEEADDALSITHVIVSQKRNEEQQSKVESIPQAFISNPRLITSIYFEDMDIDYALLNSEDSSVHQIMAGPTATAINQPLIASSMGNIFSSGLSSSSLPLTGSSTSTTSGAVRALQSLILTAKRPILVAIPSLAPSMSLFGEGGSEYKPSAKFEFVDTPQQWEILFALVVSSIALGQLPLSSKYTHNYYGERSQSGKNSNVSLKWLTYAVCDLASFSSWDIRRSLQQMQIWRMWSEKEEGEQTSISHFVNDRNRESFIMDNIFANGFSDLQPNLLSPLHLPRPGRLSMPLSLAHSVEQHCPRLIPKTQYMLPFNVRSMSSLRLQGRRTDCAVVHDFSSLAHSLGISRNVAKNMERMLASSSDVNADWSVVDVNSMINSLSTVCALAESSSAMLGHASLMMSQSSEGTRTTSEVSLKGKVTSRTMSDCIIAVIRSVRLRVSFDKFEHHSSEIVSRIQRYENGLEVPELLPLKTSMLYGLSNSRGKDTYNDLSESSNIFWASKQDESVLESFAVLSDFGEDLTNNIFVNVNDLSLVIKHTGELVAPNTLDDTICIDSTNSGTAATLFITFSCLSRLASELKSHPTFDNTVVHLDKNSPKLQTRLQMFTRAVLSAITSNMDAIEAFTQQASFASLKASRALKSKSSFTSASSAGVTAHLEWLVETSPPNTGNNKAESPKPFLSAENAADADADVLSRCVWMRVNSHDIANDYCKVNALPDLTIESSHVEGVVKSFILSIMNRHNSQYKRSPEQLNQIDISSQQIVSAPGLEVLYDRILHSAYPQWTKESLESMEDESMLAGAQKSSISLSFCSDDEDNVCRPLELNAAENNAEATVAAELDQSREHPIAIAESDDVEFVPSSKNVNYNSSSNSIQVSTKTEDVQAQLLELQALNYLLDCLSDADLYFMGRSPPLLHVGRPLGVTSHSRLIHNNVQSLSRMLVTNGVETKPSIQIMPNRHSSSIPPPQSRLGLSMFGDGEFDTMSSSYSESTFNSHDNDDAGLAFCLGSNSTGVVHTGGAGACDGGVSSVGDALAETLALTSTSLDSEEEGGGRWLSAGSGLAQCLNSAFASAVIATQITDAIVALGMVLYSKSRFERRGRNDVENPSLSFPSSSMQKPLMVATNHKLAPYGFGDFGSVILRETITVASSKAAIKSVRSAVDLGFGAKVLSSLLPLTMRNSLTLPSSIQLPSPCNKPSFHEAMSADPRCVMPFLRNPLVYHEAIDIVRSMCASEKIRIDADALSERNDGVIESRFRSTRARQRSRARTARSGGYGQQSHKFFQKLSKREIMWILDTL